MKADGDCRGSGPGRLGACGSHGQQLQQLTATSEERSKHAASKTKGCQDRKVCSDPPAPPSPSILKAKAKSSSTCSNSSSGAGDNGAVVAPAAAANPSIPSSRSKIPGKSIGGLDVDDLEVPLLLPAAACGGVGVVSAGAAAPEPLSLGNRRSAYHLIGKGGEGPEGQTSGFQASRAAGVLSSAEGLGIMSSRIAGAGEVHQGIEQDTAAAPASGMGGGSRAVSRMPALGLGEGGVAGANADVRGAGGAAARTAMRGTGVLTAELPADTAGGSLGDGRATVGIATVECGGAFGNHSGGGGGSGLRTAASASAGDGGRLVSQQQQQLPSSGGRQSQKDGSVREQQLQQVGMKKSPVKASKRPSPCVVCWESPPCVVLLPCKHLVLCEACSKMMEGKGAECPMCRAPVEQHMVIFLA